MIRVIRPYRDWQRHYPTATRIAAAIPRDVLRLRTEALVLDIQGRYGVSRATAMKAVSFARYARAA